MSSSTERDAHKALAVMALQAIAIKAAEAAQLLQEGRMRPGGLDPYVQQLQQHLVDVQRMRGRE